MTDRKSEGQRGETEADRQKERGTEKERQRLTDRKREGQRRRNRG